MRSAANFAQGIGTGIGLILAAGLLAVVWKPAFAAGLVMRGLRLQEGRTIRRGERERRLSQLAPDYLDQCRAAGL